MSRFNPFSDSLAPPPAKKPKARLVLLQPSAVMATAFLGLFGVLALVAMLAIMVVAPSLAPSPITIELAAVLTAATGLVLLDLRREGVTLGGVALRAGLAGGAVGLLSALIQVVVPWLQTGAPTPVFLARALSEASHVLAFNGAFGAGVAMVAAPIAALFTCRWAAQARLS